MLRIWKGLSVVGTVSTSFFFVICVVCVATVTKIHAATIQAKSCSYVDVSSAVSSASRGDTVVVPAGSCQWGKTLYVDRAITLKGDGSASTKISSSFQSNGVTDRNPFIRFNATSADTNFVFRLTGFEFDCGSYNMGVRVHYTESTAIPVYVRIDNNKFLNAAHSTVDPFGAGTVYFYGYIKGVFDNNYLSGRMELQSRMPTAGRWTGSSASYAHSSDECIVVEDNYFSHNNDYTQIFIASYGGCYTLRYNTIDYSSRGTSYFYPMDTHGPQPGPSYSGTGAEVYGNKIIASGGYDFASYRGGLHKVFYNKSVGSVRPTIVLWETYGPVYAGTTTPYVCPLGTLYEGTKTCSVDGRGQHVQESYLWNNRYSLSGEGKEMAYRINLGGSPYPDPAVSKAKALRENVEFWLPKSSFDGSTGVGCGPLSKRPATCSAGVGYWATNQLCSEVPEGSYGQNPATPLNGALYRCVSTNKWDEYYKPYSYPHPLRSGEAEAIDAPKGFKVANW